MTNVDRQSVDLRRADWRFLLPWSPRKTFDHLLLLGAPDGLACRLLESGIARRVSQSLPVDSPVDAAAILDGAGDLEEIERAAASLSTHGVLYCEVDRRSRGSILHTPGAVERRIKRHGLSVTGLYWPLPGFAEGRRYVPLRTDTALTWYFSHLYGCGSAQQYVFDRGVRALTANRGTRFSRMAPWFGLVASRGSGALPSVFAHPDCPEWLRRPGLQPLLLTMGIDEGSRAVMLPFVDGWDDPEAVVKVARVENVNDNVKSEQQTLEEVRSYLDASMRDTIPEPLRLFSYDGLAVGIERRAPGRAMSVSSGHFRTPMSEKIEDLRLAANWITLFNQQAQIRPAVGGAALLAEQTRRVFSEYEATFGVTPAVERMFHAARSQLDALNDFPLPIVWQHGDFGPWNISREDDEVTVIDWEIRQGPFADRSGPPMTDLIYFVTYWSFVARRIHGIDAERRGFCDLYIDSAGTDAYVDAIHQTIGRYLHELNIDRRFVVPLLVFTWVRRALESIERDRILNRLDVALQQPNSFVEWIEILAVNCDRLFTTFEPVSRPNIVTIA